MRPADEVPQGHVTQARLGGVALERSDVLLRRANQIAGVAPGGYDLRVAMIGEDPIWSELPEPGEVGQMRVKALRLIDVGDRVLHCVSAEEQPPLRQPDHCRVVAVDVGVDQLEPYSSDGHPQTVGEDRGREQERIDWRWSFELTALDRRLKPSEQLECALGGN